MGGSINKRVLANLNLDDPMSSFLEFCYERHSIYLKKVSGKPRPWTEDEILHKYKFTNLFRDLDTVTIFILNWLKPVSNNLEVLVANLIYARFCNKPSTMLATGLITNSKKEDFLRIINELGGGKTKSKVNKNSVWKGPYQVAGSFKTKLGYPYRENMIIEHIPATVSKLVSVIEDCAGQTNLQPILDKLNAVWGYNNNMVFTQVLLDLSHFRPDLIPMNASVPAGSGVEPLLKLFDCDCEVTIIREAQQAWNSRYGHIRHMYYRDAEHSLCEFRKYLCWKNGLSQPRHYRA